jgi:hypothetical protein
MFFKKDKSDNNTEVKWKEKAKTRREETKKLNKRIRELTKSRDDWKNKANKLEEKNKILNDNIKKNFNR